MCLKKLRRKPMNLIIKILIVGTYDIYDKFKLKQLGLD